MTLPSERAKILVVDDEPAIRSGLATILETANYRVEAVESGESALATLEQRDFDLALLDIRMPGMSGVELMQHIKERWPHIAVILLTGYGSLDSAIAAVRAGAADYLLKPSGAETIRDSVAQALKRTVHERQREELIERLREGLSRIDDSFRTSTADAGRMLEIGDLSLDERRHEARRGDESLDLTPTEFDLLAYLMRNPERAIGHQELVREVQGYEAEVWEARELIKYHIHTLRQKVEPDPSAPHYIHTVRGVGYKLALAD
jgi:DNA-binding response OmpR family regulator